jgi:hypothetical protein
MLAMSTLNKSIFKTYSNSITLANNHHQELVLQKSASNASTVVRIGVTKAPVSWAA